MPLSWKEIRESLAVHYGREKAELTVETLRRTEGLLNAMNQCGDVSGQFRESEGVPA